MLAATQRLSVFATVHLPLVHPMFAAKQIVAASEIGEGRFCLNVVCGWNQDEFEMFGVEQRAHDVCYAYGRQWLNVVRRIWKGGGPFDFDGDFIRLRNVEALPLPRGGAPPVMNAGASETGATFAIEECDAMFIPIRADVASAAQNVSTSLQRARAHGKRTT